MIQSLFIIVGVLFTIILWFWAITDMLKEVSKPRGFTKTTWIWMIILFPITGSLVYFHFKYNIQEKAGGFIRLLKIHNKIS